MLREKLKISLSTGFFKEPQIIKIKQEKYSPRVF